MLWEYLDIVINCYMQGKSIDKTHVWGDLTISDEQLIIV